MFRLDHIVVHIDEDLDALKQLKNKMEPLGLPFDPSRGKGTKGFKVANIWVGDQYLELPYLKKQDGGGWKKEWVEKYNQGKRGAYCLFIMTDELDSVMKRLKNKGIPLGEPERVQFKMLGFLTKTMPWRSLYTPEIPGTNLQIGFIQMDNQKSYDLMKKMMKPNARENGIDGFHSVAIQHQFSNNAWEYIQTLFHDISVESDKITFNLNNQQLTFEKTIHSMEQFVLKLQSSNKQYKGQFVFENVEIIVE